MGLLGILLGLALLIGLAYRGWSVLLLAPLSALVAALFSGEPLLAHWTQTFMGSAAGFIAQFFPMFLLGALFGKMMDDSGGVRSIANWMTETLGVGHAILAVVLAGALVTFGGVSLFVAFFVIVPMAQTLFRAATIPARLIPATVFLGTSSFTMSALPGTPSIQNAIPMPFFGTTPFAAPGLGLIAALIMFGFGLWWLGFRARAAKAAAEGYGAADSDPQIAADDPLIRERATTARDFDPAEMAHGAAATALPPVWKAMLPLALVIVTNVAMSLFILPRVDADFLAAPEWGNTSLAGVGGVWSVIVALVAGILTLLLLNRGHLLRLRETMDAGANASVLPVLSVASLVGFGAVVAALPAFAAVAEWVLTLDGGPLVSLATAVNILSALTGSASGGLTIALDALGSTYLALATELGIAPDLLHRVAVISAGTLDSLPHNGAVVTLLAVCGMKHGDSYVDLAIVSVGGAVVALVAVIALGTLFGSF